ncbi:MAG: DUF3656 domain-containing U32 family peptidase [Deltaproteobacteria bacterium]
MEGLGIENIVKIPELLAPAGNMNSFIAAIESGADAVYIGAKEFSARQYAENFSEKDFGNAVKYAHLRGSKVYLALNTLIFDQEINKALETAYKACTNSVDAIIVQDIGIASKLAEVLPQIKLHASTQMTVHNFEGVNLLKKLGFSRVVLARELSLKQIDEIAKRAKDMEIEVFIHGALCVSYSGQCLFSSMVGGRSGNRGRCAQPCRQMYNLVDYNTNQEIYDGLKGNYILSTKDLCTLEILPEIIKTGISSLKIEGRMKNSEYVATVTKIYRKYLDHIASGRKYEINRNDIEELKLVYNRGGFTRGLLNEEKGSNLMSFKSPSHEGIICGKVEGFDERNKLVKIELTTRINHGDVLKPLPASEEITTVTKIIFNGEKVKSAISGDIIEVTTNYKWNKGDHVYKVYDKKLAEKAAKAYSGKPYKKVPLYADFKLVYGNPIELIMWDDEGIKYKVQGSRPAEQANKAVLTPDKVLEQLEAMGNTPFYLARAEIEMEDQLFVPISEINDVRRKAIEAIAAERIENSKKLCPDQKNYNIRILGAMEEPKNVSELVKPKLSVLVPDFESANSVKDLNFSRIYIPCKEFYNEKVVPSIIEGMVKKGKEVLIAFPRITLKDQMEKIYENIKKIEGYGFSGALIGNFGAIKMFKILKDFKVHGDFSLNASNRYTLKTLRDFGMDGATISPELEISQITDMLSTNSDIEKELLIHGRIPLMISKYCFAPGILGSSKENSDSCGGCSKNIVGLKDRTSVVFPISFLTESCHFEVLNSKILCMAGHFNTLKNVNADYFRLNFTYETREEMIELINMYSELLEDDTEAVTEKYSTTLEEIKNKGFTKGHYFREVE